MSALLVLIGILLGTAAPASLAAVTALQWAQIGLVVAQGAPKVIQGNAQLLAFVQSPAFAQWVAANGQAAIQLQPGITTFNAIAN